MPRAAISRASSFDASGAARPPSSATSAVSWPRAWSSAAAPRRTRAACSMASREGRRRERDDEHVLHIHGARGVGAAGEHVDHRQRQERRTIGCQEPPERSARGLGGGTARRRPTRPARRWRRAAPSAGVPSRSRSAASITAWSAASRPRNSAAISPLTAATASRTPAPGIAHAAVAALLRLVATGRRARRAPSRRPALRRRVRSRRRRSASRASRAPRTPARARSSARSSA